MTELIEGQEGLPQYMGRKTLLNGKADNSSSEKSKDQTIVLHRRSYHLLAHTVIKE